MKSFEELTEFNSPLGDLHLSEKMTVHANGEYIVIKRPLEDGCVWLSIRSEDNTARHDWREFQQIKNLLVGPEIDAIERYPPESMLVDTSNQYHIWCLPTGARIPFGFDERLVSEVEIGSTKQRPFADKPSDLISETELRKRLGQ